MIDPEILSNVKMKQFVGHAPKPPHILSNQVPYDLERDEGEGVPESPMMRGESTPVFHEDVPLSHSWFLPGRDQPSVPGT